MKINNNISAVITNKHLLRTEDDLSDVMERLSSGLRINHSKDNPSGMAISNRMNAQIEGLDRATQNANDGISVIQSADGALNEVTSMLQRMRELAVQAANDTNSPTEREAIQSEMSELRDEIGRISNTTEFNTKELLDGSQDAHVYGDQVTRESVSDSVKPGTYRLNVSQAAEKAQLTGTLGTGAITADQAGTIKINGVQVQITEGMTQEQVYETVRTTAERGDVTVNRDGNNLTFTSGIKTDDYEEVLGNAFGKDAKISISIDKPGLAAYLGLNQEEEASGKDAEISLTAGDGTNDSLFTATATAKTDGNRVTITDKGGFRMDFLLDTDGADKTKSVEGEMSLEVINVGPMTLQVGANRDQNLDVRIPSVSAESLYIDQLNVTTEGGATTAINRLDEAIDRVSSIRANLGAAQNRLEKATDSLADTSENMTSAMSRIEDADMADEMTEYTKDNVLQQAATSVLAQANQIPQMALQLLQ